MSKSERSPFMEAAAAFDEQLAIYARLAEVFLKTPLTSLKHLERANQTLSELAGCEGKLQDSGQRLIQTLTASRQQQETLSAQIIAHAPNIQARNQQLNDLMAQMGQLATDVAALNTRVLGTSPQDAEVEAVSTDVLAMSGRAEQLADAARAASFDELASQAHALFQRLKAIGQKLQRGAGN